MDCRVKPGNDEERLRLKVVRGHFEAGEVEARRHRAAEQGPGPKAARALPGMRRDRGVRMIASMPVRAKAIFVARFPVLHLE